MTGAFDLGEVARGVFLVGFGAWMIAYHRQDEIVTTLALVFVVIGSLSIFGNIVRLS